jgi:hypothetical protein
VVPNNAPNDLDIGHMVRVTQKIPEVDHLAPVDLRMGSLDVFRHGTGRLAHDLEKTLGGQSGYSIGRKSIEVNALHDFFDFRDCFKNIPQPIVHGWRHSEDLNQVVCNSLGHAGLQQITHRHLHLKPDIVLNEVQDLEIVKTGR